MTLEKFANILTEFRGSSSVNIAEDTAFQSLGLDSLDMLEILMKIEEETGVVVPTDGNLKTVGNVLDFINASKS